MNKILLKPSPSKMGSSLKAKKKELFLEHCDFLLEFVPMKKEGGQE